MNENTMLVPQMGINMEQATANCEELAKAIREMTAGVLTTVNSFCRWVQRVVAEVAAQQEMETALRWASVDNRPLYNRYRHTKKEADPQEVRQADPGMVQNGGGPVLRLKANKTSLYNLVATYKPLPGMRRVDFQKANGRPDYWLEWTTDDGHTKAFLSSSLGHPILTITTQDAAGGQLYHEAHRLSVEGLRERGMVEEVTTAMERRRQAHG